MRLLPSNKSLSVEAVLFYHYLRAGTQAFTFFIGRVLLGLFQNTAGILGIYGICVLLGAIPFSEYHSVHSGMNRMEGMWFTWNR